MTVIVVGQAGLDVLVHADGLPEQGGSGELREFRQQLGGKGANQAVALAQLGIPVALVAVLGDDRAGADGCAQLAGDGIDVRAVTRRGETAVLVDLVDAPGSRRLLEQVPASQLLTDDDVRAGRKALEGTVIDTVALQLQQPAPALLAAARWGRDAGAPVVADGAPPDRARGELMGLLDVLRVDAAEAALLAGRPVETVCDAREFAGDLLSEGPVLVAVAVPGIGDLLVWPGGSRLLEHGDEPVTDPTGGGDSFVAGLIAGLRDGEDPAGAGQRATSAAAATVQRLGGRPDLHP